LNIRVAVIAALGLALAIYLALNVGLGAVFSAALAIGWSGFVIICCYALGLFLLLGAAWYVLLPGRYASLPAIIWARMVRDSASEVLPFSHVGGIVLGARAAMLHGVSQPLATASTIVDVSNEMLAQIAYIGLGVLLVSLRAPPSALTPSMTMDLVVGLALAAAAGALFLALQRYGPRIIERLGSRLFPGAVAAPAAVAAELGAIYRRRARVVFSIVLPAVGWIASAIGAWIALHLMGARVELASILAIESLVCAARSAAVIVPSALGVQEAAYAVVAPLFGVGAEFGLALSLLRRARDIVIGVPVLLIWQAIEGQRALYRVPP
jgi:glycosyltransferase 2 family protein